MTAPDSPSLSLRREALSAQAPMRSLRHHRFVCRSLGLIVRLYSRTRVEGLERLPAKPSILCFSHQSWADPLYVLGLMPASPRLYLVGPAEEDMRSGFRNRLMRWGGMTIPFKPGSRGLLAAMARSILLVQQGASVGLAGEGRIHAGERMILPLREGPAYLSLRTGAPLVPVAINGTCWLAFRRRVRIRVGSPIAPEACTSGRPTASQVETLTASLQAALEQLVVDYPEGTPPGPVGRWLTELFNDWPEGKRPDSPADRSSLGVETS